MTGSLPRNGSAPMLAPLKMPDGSATAPSLTFNAETGTGFFRVGAGIMGLAVGGVLVAQFTAGGIAGVSPLGTPIPVLDDVLPPLCVWADGRNISRLAYSALFAKWGSKYGAGDGTTTFGMPDLRAVPLVGRDNIGGTDANRMAGVPVVSGNRLTTGSIIGEILHTITLAEMPSHNHGGSTGNASPPLPQYLYDNSTNGASSGVNFTAPIRSSSNLPTIGDLTHSHTIASQGGGGSHNTVQRSFLCNFAIFAGA